MTDTEYLQNESLKISRKRAYKRTRIFFSVVTFLAAGFALACLIGILVAVVLLNVKEEHQTLYLILAGSFVGGAVLFGVVAFFLEKCSTRYAERELDFLERCDGNYNFFVGEGTLAVFNDDGLFIHSEDPANKTVIRVPYTETRFFSVCNRRRPRDKGEWSVVIEMPAHYLTKAGKGKRDDPPALVQADGKERLYNRLNELNLPLLGEPPHRNDGKKFNCIQKFKLPNRQKRKRAATLLAIGVALTVAGVFLGIFVNSTLAVVTALGLFLAGRALFSYLQAQAVLAVYREGVYFTESNRANSTFLKWVEITSVTRTNKDKFSVIKVQCPYGAYHFPDAEGAFEAMTEAYDTFKNGGGNEGE